MQISCSGTTGEPELPVPCCSVTAFGTQVAWHLRHCPISGMVDRPGWRLVVVPEHNAFLLPGPGGEDRVLLLGRLPHWGQTDGRRVRIVFCEPGTSPSPGAELAPLSRGASPGSPRANQQVWRWGKVRRKWSALWCVI